MSKRLQAFTKSSADPLSVASARVSEKINEFPSNWSHDLSSHYFHHPNLTKPYLSPLLSSIFSDSTILSAFRLTDSSESVLWRDNRRSYPRYWKSLSQDLRFFALLQSTSAWFTNPFRVVLDCKIRAIRATNFPRWKQLRLLFFTCLMFYNPLQFLLSVEDRGRVLGVRRTHMERANWCEKSSVFSRHSHFFMFSPRLR